MNKKDFNEPVPYVDLHCDTVLGLFEAKKRGEKKSIIHNDLHIDLAKLRQGGCMIQCFALFTDQKADPQPEKRAMQLFDVYASMLEENQEQLVPVYCFADIEKARREGKIGSILTLEEGDVVFNDLGMLRNWYRLGVRMIALTWNYPNSLGNPNFSMAKIKDYKVPVFLKETETEKGLTPFGKEYVKECERLGILVDVSHLGDKAFWDVISIAGKPVVASHSNARELCGLSRNLTDEMIAAIAKTGGVIGMNFCADFLQDPSDGTMKISDVIRHMQHIKEIAGIECLAIGTDFDGIESVLEIKDASGMQKIAGAMKEAGFNTEEIEKVFYKNALRVFQDVL